MPDFFVPNNVLAAGTKSLAGILNLVYPDDILILGNDGESDVLSARLIVGAEDIVSASAAQDATVLRIGTQSNSSYIKSEVSGTGSYVPLGIWVGGSSRITIATNGYIGVGINNPLVPLHVVRGDNGYVAYFQKTGSGSFGIYINDTAVQFGSNNNTPIAILRNGAQVIYVDNSNNVGISTLTPTARLHSFVSDNTVAGIFERGSGSIFAIAPGTISTSIGNQTDHPLYIITNNVHAVAILSNGNVGIGTDTPGYKLDISGDFHITGGSIFDDSITCAAIIQGGAIISTGQLQAQDGMIITNNGIITGSLLVGANAGCDLSAILEARSTTRGFLPPRMSTAEKNAISSPAGGLVVFDEDLVKLCVYTGVWETITSA